MLTSSEEIVKKIADAGIVGGWRLFPNSGETLSSSIFTAECLIINAVECEPYLTCRPSTDVGMQKKLWLAFLS